VDRAVFPVLQGGPHQSNIAAIAVGLKHLAAPEYRAYMARVVGNARRLAERLQAAGLRLATGGTDNHLMLVDLSETGIDGARASTLLERANLVVNKNKIPGGKGTAKRPFGIRLGTPAVTTRGMGPEEMDRIAGWTAEVILHPDDEARHAAVGAAVLELCRRFPIYRPTF
jgi:glycine hydroxymethyltransferase